MSSHTFQYPKVTPVTPSTPKPTETPSASAAPAPVKA
jgi:hypothetical protein